MWTADKGQSAFSIPELLVTMSLAGLVLSLFVWFLVTVSQLTEQGATRVELQQAAVLSALRMERDLRRSSRDAVTLFQTSEESSDPRVIALTPIENVDSSGQRIWKQQVLAYYWTSTGKQLIRREWPPKTAPETFETGPLSISSPTRFTDGDMTALAGGEGQRLADEVVNFTAVWVGDALSFKLELKKDVAGKQAPLQFEFEKVVSLRH